MTILKPLNNAKYIGYTCVVCSKKIDDDERQSIISLGCVQTWCGLCLIKKYPSDKNLTNFFQKKDDVILDRNKLF
jgi:hypothetical protein